MKKYTHYDRDRKGRIVTVEHTDDHMSTQARWELEEWIEKKKMEKTIRVCVWGASLFCVFYGDLAVI